MQGKANKSTGGKKKKKKSERETRKKTQLKDIHCQSSKRITIKRENKQRDEAVYQSSQPVRDSVPPRLPAREVCDARRFGREIRGSGDGSGRSGNAGTAVSALKFCLFVCLLLGFCLFLCCFIDVILCLCVLMLFFIGI